MAKLTDWLRRSARPPIGAAMAAARARAGGEARLLGLSAGGFLFALVALAAASPLMLSAPDWAAWALGGAVSLALMAACAAGAAGLWRLMRGGSADSAAAGGNGAPTLDTAIAAVFAEAEAAGLHPAGQRVARDAVTGRAGGQPIAAVRTPGTCLAVVRTAAPAEAACLLAPGGDAWPLALPADGALTPVRPPDGVDALAWSTDREAGERALASIASALRLSAGAGECPYVALRGRSLVMMWRRADLGTAFLIAHEAARGLAGPAAD